MFHFWLILYSFYFINLTGGKYEPVLTDNAYKVNMKLTIKAVTPADFGSYKCVSKNSLGDTDGSIKLYRKYYHFISIKTLLGWQSRKYLLSKNKILKYKKYNYITDVSDALQSPFQVKHIRNLNLNSFYSRDLQRKPEF